MTRRFVVPIAGTAGRRPRAAPEGLLDDGPNGAGTAAGAVYVAQRDELLRLMLDAVIATVPLPPSSATAPGDWRTRLTDLITDVVHALNAHPGIGRVALGSIPTTPAWLDPSTGSSACCSPAASNAHAPRGAAT
ncbi:hypothetical protein ABZZ20_07475 [Streptomyces sp. NPDC006430]|uniref:hypothetical protein n=1 Tax=Streptomyces sp. NPDC006430 TaxID=3154299 RepID=UPI0033A6ECDA